MSQISNQYLRTINHEMYEQMKNYSAIIEKSLSEITEKLKIKEKEAMELKNMNDKLMSTNDSLLVKLNLAQVRTSFMEKQLDMFEKEKNNENKELNDLNGFRDSENKLRDEISCLNEKLKAEQKKNLDLEKELENKKKEIEGLIKNKSITTDRIADENKNIFRDRKSSLQVVNERKPLQALTERKGSLPIAPQTSRETFLNARKYSMQEFSDVIKKARFKKKADLINKTENVEKEFVDLITDLAIESIEREFKNYSEISDYMRNNIRDKYGHYYLVTVGKYGSYNSSSWDISSRKTFSFRISDLGFALFQIQTQCIDLINAVKWDTKVEIISKNEFIDNKFETSVSDLAIESIGKNFSDFEQMSQFMSNSISERFGKRWFVAIGVYDNYDLSFNISLSNKRKFLELLMKDLRFTIFQAI